MAGGAESRGMIGWDGGGVKVRMAHSLTAPR